MKKGISRHPICVTDYDYNDILDEIDLWEKFELESYVEVLSGNEKDIWAF